MVLRIRYRLAVAGLFLTRPGSVARPATLQATVGQAHIDVHMAGDPVVGGKHNQAKRNHPESQHRKESQQAANNQRNADGLA